MNTTTLRGIFPEPKPVHKRNFVKENINNLREMQGYIQKSRVASKSQEIKPNKFKNLHSKVYSFTRASNKLSELPSVNPNRKIKSFSDRKIIHTGVQTESPEDVSKLYETGILKFPSRAIMAQMAKSQNKNKEQGDTSQNLVKNMQKLDLENKPNYIQQNIKNLELKKPKRDQSPDPLQPPPSYKRGALPKYLLEKKTEKGSKELKSVKAEEFEGENLNSLVLLPDDERKEYLRVARENYAALIKELNAMPMSNDTLKKRKRKMEIEEELKRLDEVIKIFHKPKVFVKADA